MAENSMLVVRTPDIEVVMELHLRDWALLRRHGGPR
jgi:hypothetical protein